MSLFDEDILMAQKIIASGQKNEKIYHANSFMFLTTNENIRAYQEFLQNHRRVLSVIASGDQILNTVLHDSFYIDGFDISVFPKYLFELKRAAVLSMDVEQYKKFFFLDSFRDEEFMDDTYDLIRKNLDGDFQKFWDYLFSFYEYLEVFRSFLFSQQTIGNIKTIEEYNPYLEKDFYQKLKNNLGKVNISYNDKDIRLLTKVLKGEYDFINLSSILYYESNYQEILKSLPLTEEGIILTYLYTVCQEMKEGYPECSFSSFEHSKAGVMIYKKTK